MHTIIIKNMVCPRCLDTVDEFFQKLEIPTLKIELGEVIIKNKLDKEKFDLLRDLLKDRGFEILENKTAKVISKIKSILIHEIHHANDNSKINYSSLLSEKLQLEYSYLSKLFSSVEGFTIEKYILKQKVERIKELIVYNELSLSEIATQMNYNSVAYLSALFKKETGMTFTAFKKLKNKKRITIDSI